MILSILRRYSETHPWNRLVRLRYRFANPKMASQDEIALELHSNDLTESLVDEDPLQGMYVPRICSV